MNQTPFFDRVMGYWENSKNIINGELWKPHLSNKRDEIETLLENIENIEILLNSNETLNQEEIYKMTLLGLDVFLIIDEMNLTIAQEQESSTIVKEFEKSIKELKVYRNSISAAMKDS